MITEQQEIYKILFIKRYNDMLHDGATQDKANRIANIYAVRWTTAVWQRKVMGNMRNLYNVEAW